MGIFDITFACSNDNAEVSYFRYDNPEYFQKGLIGYSLLIVKCKPSEINGIDDFGHMENLIERVISHETIHVILDKLEGKETSEKLDDFEIIIQFGMGKKPIIINMNYFGYADYFGLASDNTGLITVN